MIVLLKQSIKYNPGLYKLFDEGIVNCRDHVIRMQQAITNKIREIVYLLHILTLVFLMMVSLQ